MNDGGEMFVYISEEIGKAPLTPENNQRMCILYIFLDLKSYSREYSKFKKIILFIKMYTKWNGKSIGK